ncbi:hypothetical protein CA51_15730 [Rosistilla oblonga]|uniref:Uncharacterized protein n=1 Tax=Rosistilla oblonga TaxID=2527990 RepID=A0A518IRI8_9BACT|nr:hypothetical protein CA51_15730 [Rosistilla oblonga]QDV55694.1 hypothetical protein Mal33_16730 [Rosistilla oblonga]
MERSLPDAATSLYWSDPVRQLGLNGQRFPQNASKSGFDHVSRSRHPPSILQHLNPLPAGLLPHPFKVTHLPSDRQECLLHV